MTRPSPPRQKNLYDLLIALRWPAAMVFVALVFRAPISDAIALITNGEFSFSKSGEVRLQVQKLAQAVQQIPPQQASQFSTGRAIQGDAQANEIQSTITDILNETSKSPKVALLKLSFALEKKAGEILSQTNWGGGRTDFTLSQSIQKLMEFGQLPPFIPGALRQFETVRSQIVQNGNAASTSDLLSAIDSGLSLLKILYALPIERNVVYNPGVALYSDSSCTTPITDAKGLVLETTSPGGGHKVFRIFPTTSAGYVKGEAVSWEWNMGKVWNAAWYRDPDSYEIKLAWESSAEFAGRDLEKLYPNAPSSNP